MFMHQTEYGSYCGGAYIGLADGHGAFALTRQNPSRSIEVCALEGELLGLRGFHIHAILGAGSLFLFELEALLRPRVLRRAPTLPQRQGN